MHKVTTEKKTFSNILVAIDELDKSTASTDRAVDYAANIALDYGAQLIILHVVRADARVHGLNPPSHIIEMKKQAEASFAKITENLYGNKNRYNCISQNSRCNRKLR
jgi:nucleotide-binding universal stress UspA family protein